MPCFAASSNPVTTRLLLVDDKGPLLRQDTQQPLRVEVEGAAKTPSTCVCVCWGGRATLTTRGDGSGDSS